MTTIWIVRRHPLYPYGSYGNPQHIEAFTIFKTCATKKEAGIVAALKNSRNTYFLYTVGRVSLKDAT